MNCPNAELQDLAAMLTGEECSPTDKLHALLGFLARQNSEMLAMKGAIRDLYGPPSDDEYGPISDDDPFIRTIDQYDGRIVSFPLSQIALIRWTETELRVVLKGVELEGGATDYICLERKAGERLEDIISGHKSIINLVLEVPEAEGGNPQ